MLGPGRPRVVPPGVVALEDGGECAHCFRVATVEENALGGIQAGADPPIERDLAIGRGPDDWSHRRALRFGRCGFLGLRRGDARASE